MECETVIGIEEIQEILLHRYPFLLVDRVVELEAGQRIVTIKNVTANEQFFQGHFPGHPVMPGVLILEAMAQSAGILLKKSEPEMADMGIFLVGANDFKWKKMVTPGDTLRLEITFIKRRGPLWNVGAEATVAGALVAKGELSAIAKHFD